MHDYQFPLDVQIDPDDAQPCTYCLCRNYASRRVRIDPRDPVISNLCDRHVQALAVDNALDYLDGWRWDPDAREWRNIVTGTEFLEDLIWAALAWDRVAEVMTALREG